MDNATLTWLMWLSALSMFIASFVIADLKHRVRELEKLVKKHRDEDDQKYGILMYRIDQLERKK